MKVFGILIAGILLSNLALADNADSEQDESLTLAAYAPKQMITLPDSAKAAAPEIKVIDVDLSDRLQSLNETISDKLEAELNEQMRLKLESF